jgi:hypothetical protein
MIQRSLSPLSLTAGLLILLTRVALAADFTPARVARDGPLPVTRNPSWPADPGCPAACRWPTGLASGVPPASVRRGASGGAGGKGHALARPQQGGTAWADAGGGKDRWHFLYSHWPHSSAGF